MALDLQSSINSYGKVLALAENARADEEAKELELRKKDIYSAAAQKEMIEKLRADHKSVRDGYRARAEALFDEIDAEIERNSLFLLSLRLDMRNSLNSFQYLWIFFNFFSEQLQDFGYFFCVLGPTGII